MGLGQQRGIWAFWKRQTPLEPRGEGSSPWIKPTHPSLPLRQGPRKSSWAEFVTEADVLCNGRPRTLK